MIHRIFGRRVADGAEGSARSNNGVHAIHVTMQTRSMVDTLGGKHLLALYVFPSSTGGLASMAIALGAVVVALSLGLLVGLASVLAGPRVDGLLTLGVDVGRALPWLLLVLALRARRPLEMAPLETLTSLALILRQHFETP